MSAEYTIKTTADGIIYAQTIVSWSRKFGKCKRQDFHRCGEIFTQSRFRAWCKKYDIKIDEEDVQKLPKKVWWL